MKPGSDALTEDMLRTTHITHRRQERQPVSTRRPASYYRRDASVLPEQFFDSRVKLAAVCPETAMMYAVLEDAFLCFHKQFEPEPRFIERAREAEDWFFSGRLSLAVLLRVDLCRTGAGSSLHPKKA